MKTEVLIKHTQTYRVFVHAKSDDEAKAKAFNTVFSGCEFKAKHLVDDNLKVTIINEKTLVQDS